MQGLRRIAVHLALGALMLRALLPAGWMPNPAGGTNGAPFVICTMDGPAIVASLHPADKTGGPQAPSDPRAHEVCPFAAAAQLAPPAPGVPILFAALATIAPPHRAVHFADPQPVLTARPAAPRAPPAPI